MGGGGWGAIQRPVPRVKTGGAYMNGTLVVGWGKAEAGVGRGPPDLTLPLVEMAEMDRPVMDVTKTESRMMIQVSTVGVGGDVVTPKSGRACPRRGATEGT